MIRSGLEEGASRETCHIAATGEALGEAVNLTAHGGLRRFAVHHERLAPGRRASPPHAHSEKEEFVYVLRGRPTLWLDGVAQRLQPHDAVSLAVKNGVRHFLSNDTEELAEYLVVSTPTETDVVSW